MNDSFSMHKKPKDTNKNQDPRKIPTRKIKGQHIRDSAGTTIETHTAWYTGTNKQSLKHVMFKEAKPTQTEYWEINRHILEE